MNIQLNVAACLTYPDKFIRDMFVATCTLCATRSKMALRLQLLGSVHFEF